jgi:hypothetical protein
MPKLAATVTHLAEDITDVRGGTVPNLFSGYMETNSVHYRTIVSLVLENVNKK